MWDWGNASLSRWYAGAATSALTTEAGVDGAFFDDFDGSVCPFESAYDRMPSRYTAADRVAMHVAKMTTFGKVAAALCSAGQLPILAMATTFGDSGVQ